MPYLHHHTNNTYSLYTLKQLLRTLEDRHVIVFDLETNGLSSSNSVLSISAIKYRYEKATSDLIQIDSLSRYYFSREKENPKALRINGLNSNTITDKRIDANYPLYFDEDREIVDFFLDSGLVAAHNVDFDKKFLKIFPELDNLNYFCTMKTNGNYIKLYNLAISENIDVDTGSLHDSMYDAKIAAAILAKFIKKYLQEL